MNRPELGQLFENQLRTLRRASCPLSIARDMKRQKALVVEAARKQNIRKGHIPFLPVISRERLEVLDQIAMLRNGEKVCFTYRGTHLMSDCIDDLVPVPASPLYFLLDIDVGSRFAKRSPTGALRQICAETRTGLTEPEIISLSLHSDVLKRYAVCAASSRSDNGDRMPYLGIDDDRGGRPWLDWQYATSPLGAVIPSCARRLACSRHV